MIPLAAIDPGKHGAIAVLLSSSEIAIADFPLGKDKEPNRQRLFALSKLCQGGTAYIESPQFRPHDGKDRVMKSGIYIECWQFPLIMHGVSLRYVSATVWKRSLNLFGKGKEGSRELAKEKFPAAAPALSRKKDHDRAEALLLLQYALYQEGRDSGGVSVDLY